MKLVFMALVVGVSAMVDMGLNETQPEIVEGEWIVVLQKHLAVEQREAHMNQYRGKFPGTLQQEFNINNGEFVAYHIKGLSTEQVEALRAVPEVRYIESNVVGRPMHDLPEPQRECTRQTGATWGISRTVHRGSRPNPFPPYEVDSDACGEDVDIYILDTGMRETHQDYGGRGTWNGGADYVGTGFNDPSGHGTHVASTAGGERWGLARCATLISIKVCFPNSCPAEAQLAGIQHVERAATAARGTRKRVVGNMSIGSPFRQFINDAIEALTNAGGIMVVAGGNENQNACLRSPSSAPFALTVGATTNTDARASFSNWGTCINIFAPGAAITAAWRTSDTASNTISGTSMASPHGAGLVAKFWSKEANRNKSPVTVMREIEGLANPGVVGNPGTGSPNRLGFFNCGS